jgi:hypothetical protein
MASIAPFAPFAPFAHFCTFEIKTYYSIVRYPIKCCKATAMGFSHSSSNE